MKDTLKPGITFRLEELVTKAKSAAAMGSGLLDVYATPAMIAIMEDCANQCLMEYLDEDENTVGSEVNVRHLKPTPIGMQVWCDVEVIEVEGRKVTFRVHANDEVADIGEGTHVRYVINTEKFMSKIQ